MDQHARAALRHANKVIRAEGGTLQTDLSKGERSSASSCPISNTVMAGVPGNLASTTPFWTSFYPGTGDWRTYDLSPSAKEFTRLFDGGGYDGYADA